MNDKKLELMEHDWEQHEKEKVQEIAEFAELGRYFAHIFEQKVNSLKALNDVLELHRLKIVYLKEGE